MRAPAPERGPALVLPLFFALGVWLAACAEAPSAASDIAAADSAAADSAAADSDTNDSAAADSAAADTAEADGAEADSGGPDSVDTAVADSAGADSVDAAVADSGAPDSAGADSAGPDSAGPDSATADASDNDAEAPDSAEQDIDAGPKQTAWGQISGVCGAVAAELGKPTPSFLVATYAFTSAPAFDPSALAAGAKKRYLGPNAGGSSKCSEVMSMQYLVDCDGGSDILTEVELEYTKTDTSITDFALKIAGKQVGVSVTRAYLGPKVSSYTEADATKLLTKKLEGILESSQFIAPKFKWVKQVLAVWTLQPSWVPIVEAAWLKLDPAVRADTVILVLVEQGPGWIVAEKCLTP